MSIQIRKAGPGDLDAVARIYHAILQRENQGGCTGWLPGIYPVRATAEAALARDDLFVEETAGQIVGAAILNRIQVDVYRLAPWQYPAPEEQVMVMHTLVTDPAAAGQGLGTAFARYYEQYALEQGCPYLRIDTNAKNTRARRFYQKLQYREVAVLPCDFNGIPNIQLVLLEKKLEG